MGVDQVPTLLLTAMLFAVLMKKKYSAGALLFSVAAGAVTLVGHLYTGLYILYAIINGLITFMMWYCFIAAVMIVINFLSRDRRR